MDKNVRINKSIQAPELRVIGANGENIGVISLAEALKLAVEAGLDLIEISPSARPPVAKIMDYGKFQYDQKKKLKIAKAKTHTVEVKSIQVKLATGEHDLALKAKKASEWLKEGHRVKIELFLRGREKYMEKAFLETRLKRALALISEDFSVAEAIQKAPKGLVILIEKKRS